MRPAREKVRLAFDVIFLREMAGHVSVSWRLRLGTTEEYPQLLDDRVLLVDEYQVMGIVDHVHLRIWRLVSADDRQDGMAAFGQPFDATAATQPS
jgi:hypothetical protein